MERARSVVIAVLLGAASVAHVGAQTDGEGKWQVEIRGGAATFTNPSSGTTALPAPVVDATLPDGRQVRRVQSWYFGEGPVYLQQGRPPVVMPPMVPLDPVLTARSPRGLPARRWACASAVRSVRGWRWM